MDVNQFAVYQLKNIPENRQIRFRPYSTLQEKRIQIQYEDYEQVYLARMQMGDGPEQIRKRFNEKLPRTFQGHSISVSDVLVLNKGGVVTSYYVEKDGFTVIAGFIQKGSFGALVSIDTSDFHIEGKEGNWHAFDSIIIDGRRNNMSPKGKNGRVSVLAKLRRKQAEIAKRSGKPAQQMAMAEDMERRRK